MAHHGTIKSYDSSGGVGTISPDNGGEALSFKKSDLQQEGPEPQIGQRYGYETYEIYGNKRRAVYLQLEGEALSDTKH